MAEYREWSHADLVKRVMDLEAQLRSRTKVTSVPSQATTDETTIAPPKRPRLKKAYDPSRYSTHHIALKFAYLGANYNGFEHHANNTTALPTVEEVLWRAMMKARLIFPTDYDAGDQEHWEGEVTWAGCDYSKCGRTDRGVSAFGQVIGIRMRSNRPLPKRTDTEEENAVSEAEDVKEEGEQWGGADKAVSQSFDPVRDELNYPAVINRLLPPDIRILAWCPAPAVDFSARFSCRERRYRYFFTQPAFLPHPGTQSQSASLDIEAMRRASSHLVGTHDFRNFCKIDAAKQITNFTRRITHASIEEVSSVDMPSFFAGQAFQRNGNPGGHLKVCALHLHGSAFLWHQVRCIMAILFLVGQGLERPDVVQGLLDMSEDDAGRGGKPRYEMANELPLVLWDCIFPKLSDSDEAPNDGKSALGDAMPWIYVGQQGVVGSGTLESNFDARWGTTGIMDGVWRQWRNRKMHELLAAALTDHTSSTLGHPAEEQSKGFHETKKPEKAGKGSTLIYDGGHGSRAVGKYIPLLQRERLEPVEVINERYAKRKSLVVDTANGDDADA